MNNVMKNIDLEENEASKLVFDIVQKVFEPRELESQAGGAYQRWSTANDGTFMGHIERNFENSTNHAENFWSKYSGDLKRPVLSNFNTCENQQLQLIKNMEFNANCMQRSRRKFCTFCKKNGESMSYCTSHALYENGTVSCPVLQQCICKICGQKGHTMSHCHQNGSRFSILKQINRFNTMKKN